MSKYGLQFDKPSPEHYVLGRSGLKFEVINPEGDWTPYLPEGEIQSKPSIETYACVVHTLLNCLEILIFKKYGIRENFSERFLATILETGKGGTTPQLACEALRNFGVPKETEYPFDTESLAEYFKTLSPELYELAKEFTAKYDFWHEFVEPKNEAISYALTSSPLMASVSAWKKREDGIYYRPEGLSDNHAVTLVYERIGAFRRIFDSYVDGDGDPYIKDYDYNAMPMIIKRFHIELKKKVVLATSISLWKRFLNWLQNLIPKTT